eukprot:4170928-Pyramimonas_sp.AAC.1
MSPFSSSGKKSSTVSTQAWPGLGHTGTTSEATKLLRLETASPEYETLFRLGLLRHQCEVEI